MADTYNPNTFVNPDKKADATNYSGLPEDFVNPDTPKEGTTLGALGRTLLRVPENLVAQGIGAVQGQTGVSVNDQGIADKLYNWVQKRNERLAQDYEGTGDTIIPGISKQDVAQLGPNLAFSGISMGASLAGSLPGGGPMSPVGIAGGMAAGGGAAYRMQSYQTMNEWLQKKNDESLQQFGRAINPDEEKAFRTKFESLAAEGGLWEAGPEAVGNVLELALMAGKGTLPGRILSMIPDGLKGKLIKGAARMAGILGTEEATETVTQMGQHNVEVAAGMSEEPMRSWTSGEDWLKSAQEVLPAVLLLSGFMGAGGAMYRRYKANTDNELGQKIDEAMEGMPDQNAAIQTQPSEFDTPIGAETTAVNPAIGGQPPVVDQSQPVIPEGGGSPADEATEADQIITDKPVIGPNAIDQVAAIFPVNSKIVDANGNTGIVTGHKESESGPKIQVTWDNVETGKLPLAVAPDKISLLTETPPPADVKKTEEAKNETPVEEPEENAAGTPEPPGDKQVITPEAPPAGPVPAAKKSAHQMTTDEYIQEQFDALDDQTKAEVLADKQAAADLENKWTAEHIAEVISAQQRGETIPPEVMDGIKAKIPVTETGTDKAPPEIVEPGASSREGAGTPAIIDLQGKRSWYDFKDLKNSELNDEEAERVMLDTGPTPEETAEWNARQGAAGQRQAEAAAKEAEEIKRQGEVMRRSTEGRAKGAPEMHIKEVASRIDGIRATKGNTHKVSAYAQHFSDAVGVPNKYEFLAKIADKLGITVHITDAESAAPPGEPKTDGTYNIDTGIITISPRAMANALDRGPGYGIAHGWELITHEILHGVARKSAKYASARKRLLEFRNSLTPYMANAPAEMVSLMNHIDRYDIDEMVSEAFTNQTFAQWLDSIPAEGVKNPSKTFWGKLKDIIMQSLETFGLPKSKLSELNEIMDQVLPVEMAEEKAPAPPENKPPAPPEVKPPPEIKENQYGTPEKINTVELSNLLSQHIDATYGKIDKSMVKGWVAEAFGLTDQELNALEKINRYDHKAVEEAFEYAIVKITRTNIEVAKNAEDRNLLLDYLIKEYNNQPNLASRTSESTIMQQYSTPAPLAWLMNNFLGLFGTHTSNNFTVYEPTAGNGMLLVGAKPKYIVANELDKGARLAHLRDLISPHGGMVVNKDAKDWTPGGKTQDRVVANPPFGAVAEKSFDGYKMTKLEHQIIAEALGAMKDNGKAAFIIGGHNIKDTGRMTGTDQIFFNWLYNHYNVTHNIDINGDLYARQGTKFPVRLITIEGRKATPDTGIAKYTGIEPAETFYDIRDILDRRADEKPAGGEAENTGKEGNGNGPGPDGGTGENPDAKGAEGNGSGEPGGGNNSVPGKGGNGPKPGGGRDERAGDKRPGVDGVQPGKTPTGGREPVPDDGVGEPDVSGNKGQGADVAGSKEGNKPAGVKDDFQKAVDKLADLFMPYEGNNDEAFDEKLYEKVKPVLQETVEEAINKHGFDSSLNDVNQYIKDSMEPSKYKKAFQYIFKFVRTNLDNIIGALKSGLKFQKKYAPRSKGQSGNTLIPKNQEQAVQEALDKIEAAHGNIDQWVMSELKYANTEALYKAFSAEQIDALAMAIDNIGTNNAGFILGDQTGVGKGRVVAGMIRYANVNGKIPVFVTAQPNLFTDMYRDLTGIDHRIKPFILNNHDKKRPANITDQATGEVIHYADRDGEVKNKKEDIRSMTADPEKFLRDNEYKALFTTYSQHNQKNSTVKDNIIAALSKDNIIIIDESHEAAGASKIDPRKGPSNTNRKFIGFLNEASGVLYSSATYAKAPANMVLYFRTVLGDAGISMKDLLQTIENGGVPFQEYLSNIIARMGQYVRRELDFKDVNYNITLTMDEAKKGSPEAVQLKKEFEEHKKIADATNEHVMDIKEFDSVLKGRYRQELIRILTDKFGVVMGGLPDRFNPSITMFTSLLHNIEQQLLSSIKVEKTLAEAKLSLDKGQKVVIAFDNTMESFLDDVMDKNKLKIGDKVNFTFKAVLERALDNCLKFSTTDAQGHDVEIRISLQDLEEEIPEAAHLFKEVMARIQRYNQNLHASPIDYLRSELAKHSKKPVYEITGRNHMVDYDGEGGQKRIADRKDPNKNDTISAFNNGKCDVIILNKSGSSGLSLHTDPQFKDKRQRKMIIHQANRDINVHMQILGRVNRKGQVNPPEYLDVVTSLPAELRPLVVREQKLASLNANTTSSQEGATRTKKHPDMMNVYGNQVTRDYLAKNPELAMSIGLINHPHDDIPQDDSSSYAKVSGKIAVLPVEAQKEFFDDIESMYNSLIDEVNARGENELISKDYDFQARMIEKRMLVRDTFAGANSNPILDAVHIEKMQVRMLNKPHNIAKLTQLITDVLEIKTEKKTDNEIQQEIITQREQFAIDLKEKIKKAADEYFQTWQAKLPEKYDNPETIAREAERKQRSMSSELNAIHAAINQYKLGATYSIPVDRDNTTETYTGVLVNILWSEGAGNPVQPGKTKFVFSLNDPKQTAVNHVGQQWFVHGSRRIDAFIPTNWNDDLPQDKHEPEPRYIITGSMLKAYMAIPDGARVEMISFTRDDGKREFGLLVAKKDEDKIWGHRVDDAMLNVRWQEAMEYVTHNADAGERFVSTVNGLITIKKRAVRLISATGLYENEYMVNVPSSKEGAPYYQDKDLMALVRGGNFRKQSSRMMAVVEPANIAEFLRLLQEKHDITFRIPNENRSMPFTAAAEAAEQTATYSNSTPVSTKITNPSTIARLEAGKKIKAYRAMQIIDGKLYPPMSASIGGKLRTPTEIGAWEQAAEMPELADDKGHFKLEKGNKKTIKARYNPYFHTSRSPLNDQFAEAYNRPNLVTVEVEVPESELASGYKADKAKDSVGEVAWHSGPVSSKLPADKSRKVILSRYAKVVRVVPDSEVAGHIAELLSGEDISIPDNVVTPSLKSELIKRGVNIVTGLQKEANVNPKDKFLPAPYIPAALQDKMDKMTDAILSRPQTIIPKEALNKVRAELKSQENFKVTDKYFGLPWWNAQKYPVWQKAFDIFGIKRPEMRGNLMNQFASLAEPFLKLDANMKAEGFKKNQIADAKSRIQKIIVAGDALLGKEYRDLKRQVKMEEKQPDPDKVKIAEWKARINQIETLNRYSDEELRAGVKNEYGEIVKLNNREIEVYTRVRAALDNMFDTYHAHLQAQAFRTYQKNKWYAILCQAAGADLQSDAVAKLIGSGLRGAALTYAQRIQVDIQGIFERVDKGIEETSDIEKKTIGEIYGVIANRMTADVKRLREHLGKVTGLQGEDLTDATKQILAAYVKTKPEMKRIKSLRNLYKKQIAFFPRVREQGKYKLHLVEHILDDDGNLLKDRKIHSEMFSNEAEYKVLYSKYMARYAKSGKLPDNYEIMAPEMVIKTPETAFQGVNDINMQKILDDAIDNMKMKDGNWAEKLRTAGYQAIAGQFQSRGWGSHLKHRQWNVVKGYEEQDLQKILFNYLSGMSGIMTKQVAGAEFLEMMKDVKNPTMFEGLSKYGKDQLRNSNQMDKMSQKARSFMFTWYLGGILRPAAVQVTQNFVTAIPEFAKYLRENKIGGAGKADMLYMKAMKDIASGKMNNNKNLTPQEQRMQRELLTDGVTQDQYIKAIFEGLGDRFDQNYNKVMKWLAMPFSFMEMYNRQAAALTMFRTAYKLALKEDGATEETAYQKAFDKAREFVYNTHYAMDKANLPQLAQGGDATSVALKTAYTFRSFTHNFILWQKNNLTSGDWKTAMHSLAYMALFGGLMGLPFFKDLFEWIEKQFGYSPATTVRTALRGVGGQTLETFGFSGLPAVLGMNISGSLALGIPGMGETPLDSVYGVYGGTATKIGRAVDAAGRGDLYRVSANLAPEFLRNPIVAMMESDIGKSMGAPGYSTTTRGRAIYGEQGKPIQMTAGQAAVKFTGFNPTGNAREKEQNQVIKRQEEWGQEAKRDLSETYRIEKTNRDPKAMQHLMTGVKELNQKIRDRGIQQIVPLVNVSTIIKNSRETMNKKQRKEIAYKQAAL